MNLWKKLKKKKKVSNLFLFNLLISNSEHKSDILYPSHMLLFGQLGKDYISLISLSPYTS